MGRSKGRRRSSQERDRRRISGDRDGSVRVKEEREDSRGIHWETNKGQKRTEREKSWRREEDRGRRGEKAVVKEEPESPARRDVSGERRQRRDSSGRKQRKESERNRQREESGDRRPRKHSEERDREEEREKRR